MEKLNSTLENNVIDSDQSISIEYTIVDIKITKDPVKYRNTIKRVDESQ
ncbi:hypothetical protein KKB10_05440 [Patescibacteria group bacterium]|nr:hypothetical protein [Patescibacteria group bacterium]MBU1075606.1 hypothetical protein [Patescibacteria group bacterium]MBU1951704.1 hypothetical protein [Patescibacteria group bacterium]